jgi:hypothetical protein
MRGSFVYGTFGSKHNLAGEWALIIFLFCKIPRQISSNMDEIIL